MAEFCRDCFIKTLHPSQYDIDHIVMSEDWYLCEGCGKIGPYVDHIDGYLSDEEQKTYRDMLKKNSKDTGINIFDLMEEKDTVSEAEHEFEPGRVFVDMFELNP